MRTEVVHEIVTPELVPFEFELAGMARRGLAWCLDMLIIGLAVMGVSIGAALLGLLSGGVLSGPALAAAYVLVFLFLWGYFVLFEWRWQGQTPGKLAMGLRVLRETGVEVSFQSCLVRNLVRLLDSLPSVPLVGLAAALGNGRRQRLGDMVAGTVVVRERTRPLPSAIVPPSERYNTLLKDRRAAARARDAVTPRLRELLVSLAMRREALDLSARLSLFGLMARHLEDLGIARPRAISDERFVLGVTAAALGAKAPARARGDDAGPSAGAPPPSAPLPARDASAW